MGNFKNLAQIITGLLIIVGLFFGVWFIIREIWHVFSGLQKEVAAAIVAAIATVLVSIFSIILSKFYERKLLIEKEMREKKIPVYDEFIDFIMNLLSNHENISESEMKEFFVKFTQKILIWGSDEVIKQWSRYRKIALRNLEEDQSVKLMFELEQLLLAIRKDTGHKSSKIKRGELLGIFINDIDDYI
ncbi:hypothetical protein MXL46_20295 [Heyndrickxia sporothermodurans]|uniref:Uncharacterized protein n=2 Tax=Heyndrickxia sporothermodurans TaxID=46224 RepID=A0A150KKZ3_9BACI|nr:hypothetical protein [Heyndrickxia sporothermodurans]KYC88636.1 hypothetical protein B4102_3994 [Heyndrickxia sporothermodurans]MEB6551357.1 hypothetical protein [Heyndrickxia sporothermodurans]